ncbi:conserved hypothetical protein [Desulfatibacillum aliphaticivorans]|jgi:hypothetical protein|uniref:Uncharacterized protein n=2 Tax=Desulfatibacillum TaxID=218207 RepID=B8FGP2_DESAL|nr:MULTISPECIES: hypothetical protein [Desulfatibacillum]ACL05272.1 conserved hypothetical protein [Desulfatibacillum aliphaticivorans]SHJ50498.1 hypothetical protein SAMN02745216_01778 [Desulfatibacillum alkenivorans DSM 16219]
MENTKKNLFVSLSFEKTSLPPFEDVLILGRDCPLGMNGVGQCLDLLVPDGYDRFEVDDDHVTAIIVNKSILNRISTRQLIEILQKRVFPYVGRKEIIKVDFAIKIAYDTFSVDQE